MKTSIIKSILHKCENLRIIKDVNLYILQKIKNTDNVAIWGTGKHTEQLLKVLEIDKFNLKCFIDSNNSKWGKEYHSSKIYPPTAIFDFPIDIVIVSSYEYHSEITTQLRNDFPKCKYIDLYDELKYNKPFYYIDFKYKLFLETCLLIKKDLEKLGITLEDDLSKKLDKFIAEVDDDRDDFADNNLINTDYLKTYLKNNNKECDCKENNKIKVTFFIQNPNTWSSTASVYEAFLADDRADVKIVQLPFIHKFDSEYHKSRSFLLEKEIPFIPWYFYNVEEDKPDIVIYHSPYDSTRPEMYSVENIKRLGIKIVYIPYCQELFGGEITSWFFNNDIHRDAWKIYVRSEKYKQMFKKNSIYSGENLVITGHPKFDSLALLKDFRVKQDLITKIGDRIVFLWNPHFYFADGISGSTFNIFKDFILSIFRQRDDLFLIIRPHPLLFGSLTKINNGDTTVVDNFRNTINSMGNVMLDESNDYREAFVLSNALISDTSSFLLTYMPTYKPILHLIGEHGIELNEDGQDIANACYKASSKEDIKNFIDMVVAKKDPLLDLRISKLREHLTYSDGKCGYRIKEDIINSIYIER
ncbi:MAG: CDP-glycerol glycerophosphotransferase family protein [Peptococcia bacterium]